MRLPAYDPKALAHPVVLLEVAPGVFATVCGTCSARNGEWEQLCPQWLAPPPLALFSSHAIASQLEEVFFELVRTDDDEDETNEPDDATIPT